MCKTSQALVIGDNLRMIDLLQRWLIRAGYQTIDVTTVQAEIEALTASAIAWVITDLMMPTGDGIDIMAYTRTQQPQAKIIMMSAFGSGATRQLAFAQGTPCFLEQTVQRRSANGHLDPSTSF
jgi:CheY-like chemotaxis protein